MSKLNIIKKIETESKILWEKDFSLRRVFDRYNKLVSKITNFKESNPVQASVMDECSSSITAKITAFVPILVMVVDYVCGFPVLSLVAIYFSFLNEYLATFLICLVILGLEYYFGKCLHDEKIKKDYTTEIDSNPIFWKRTSRLRYMIFFVLGCVFICIVPTLSLVEYQAQIAVNDQSVQLGFMTEKGRSAANESLRIWFFSIAALSFISHAYVVFYTHKISNAFDLLRFNSKFKRLEQELDKVATQRLKHISSVMKSVVVLENLNLKLGLLNDGKQNDILQGFSLFIQNIVREVKVGNMEEGHA